MVPPKEILAAVILEIQQSKLRPNDVPPLNLYRTHYAHLMQQMKIDWNKLHATGMSMTLRQKYECYFFLTNEKQIEALSKNRKTLTFSDEYNEKMATAEVYLQSLILVIYHIIDTTNDETILNHFKSIKKRSSTVQKLHNIIDYLALVERHLDEATSIKPGGVTIDMNYIYKVRSEMYSLLQLHALHYSEYCEIKNKENTRQSLVSLMIQAEKKLNQYARAAFLLERDYYNCHYPIFEMPNMTISYGEQLTKPQQNSR